MRIIAIMMGGTALMLGGCASKIVTRNVPVEVRVPVAQPCATERPAKVAALKDRIDDRQWRSMDVRQKSAAVGRQALDRQTYGEALDAATAACPEVAG